MHPGDHQILHCSPLYILNVYRRLEIPDNIHVQWCLHTWWGYTKNNHTNWPIIRRYIPQQHQTISSKNFHLMRAFGQQGSWFLVAQIYILSLQTHQSAPRTFRIDVFPINKVDAVADYKHNNEIVCQETRLLRTIYLRIIKKELLHPKGEL